MFNAILFPMCFLFCMTLFCMSNFLLRFIVGMSVELGGRARAPGIQSRISEGVLSGCPTRSQIIEVDLNVK